MYKRLQLIIAFLLMYSNIISAQHTSYFSSVLTENSKTESVIVDAKNVDALQVSITGNQAMNFKHLSTQQVDGGKAIVKFRFEPSKESRGISRAKLEVKENGNSKVMVNLRGVGIPALEGENEAALAEILDILDITTNVGWNTLPNNVNPDPIGEELNVGLFRKATNGDVTITPIARYSPPSLIPFGFYTLTDQGPSLNQVGVLSDSEDFHEHQTLFPDLALGSKKFDPVHTSFGIYVSSQTHNSYTEDVWNILNAKEHASHSTRIYPVRNKLGELVKNSYLVCYEEAANGDYQDYVFLLENVNPVDPNRAFTKLLNQNDLDGWDIFMDEYGLNSDPGKMFSMKNGILKVIGKDLGYIITEKSYENYHFQLEFKWGEQKWPPRLEDKRDSGVCYHIPEGDENRVWPLSVECQIQEGDVGDFWLLGFNTIEVDGKQNMPKQYSNIVKAKDNEKPTGEWNTVDIISYNGTCVHVVNGQVVNFGTNSSLKKGRILLQSEYAEVYYKNVKIREF